MMKRANKIFSIFLLMLMVFATSLSTVKAEVHEGTGLNGEKYRWMVDMTQDSTSNKNRYTVSLQVTEGTMYGLDLYLNPINVTIDNITAISPFTIATESSEYVGKNSGTIPVNILVDGSQAVTQSFVQVVVIEGHKTDASLETCLLKVGVDPAELKEVTEDPKATTPENPKTGSMDPVAAVVGGIALVAVVYINSKKNTKVYKI